METPKMWIDGKACEAVSGETIPTEEPAKGQTLTQLPRGNKNDVDLAVRAARKAFVGEWSKMPPPQRAKCLWCMGELIENELESLAQMESRDTGKPLANTLRADIPLSADTFHYFSGWATKLHGDTIPVRTPHLNYTLREPLGVVGAIIPWNFPLLLGVRKIAPALAAGNTVVLKPPEEASLTCMQLGRIAQAAGIPDGVLNIVSGLGEEAGAALVAHPGVAKIAFTGGTDTGKLIARSASDTLKKLSLELGGKCPNIVFADADLDAATQAAVRAAYYNSGQVCTAGSRLLVESKVYDRVLEGVANGASALKVGDPLDRNTEMGPLITKQHKERVQGFVSKGANEGASKVAGEPYEGEGEFVTPTVFGDVRDDMTIAQEEIFGPVVSVMRFENVEDALRIADGTPYGLAAGIWTRDIGKGHSLAAKLRAGTVWINTYNNFDAASPYGGTKQSGYGRENGADVMLEVTQGKSVWVALDSP